MKIYKTEQYKKWLTSVKDRKAVLRIDDKISKLEAGIFGDSHTVGGYVSELRIDYGPGYRIYFTKKGEEIIILLAGGTKKRQSEDILKAQKLAKKWR